MRIVTTAIFVLLTMSVAWAGCTSTCYTDASGMQHCRWQCDRSYGSPFGSRSN
jgi:hypothetical protein